MQIYLPQNQGFVLWRNFTFVKTFLLSLSGFSFQQHFFIIKVRVCFYTFLIPTPVDNSEIQNFDISSHVSVPLLITCRWNLSREKFPLGHKNCNFTEKRKKTNFVMWKKLHKLELENEFQPWKKVARHCKIGSVGGDMVEIPTWVMQREMREGMDSLLRGKPESGSVIFAGRVFELSLECF